MAGDIKLKYGSSASFTFTSANSLAGSGTWVAGAGSLAVSNSTPAVDELVSGIITWSSTAPASGAATYFLYVYVYGSVNDTPTYPQDGSGNNFGTDVARTFAATTDRDNAVRLGAVVQLSATANKVYSFAPFSVAALFGGSLPNNYGLWVTHGVTTASSTINSTGNTWSRTPVFAQYT